MISGQGKIDDLVENIIAACGIDTPPVNPFFIVRDFEQQTFKVELPSGLRVSVRKVGDLTEFLINKDLRYEQQCFALAHEIFERLLDIEDKSIRHHWANLGASCLLMPERFFLPMCRNTSYDLLELRDIFTNVSCEAIVYRMLHFRPGVATIYDNGSLTRRVGAEGCNYPPKPLPIEVLVHDEVMRTGEGVSASTDGVSVKGWPVFENNWKRVILFAEADF